MTRPGGGALFAVAGLAGAGVAAILLWVPAAGGWRAGGAAGLAAAAAVAGLAFRWRRASLARGGTAFLGGLVGGFLMNLVFLAGGTILARFTGWPGHYQAYAFGYLGGAFLGGGILTWALRGGGARPAGGNARRSG